MEASVVSVDRIAAWGSIGGAASMPWEAKLPGPMEEDMSVTPKPHPMDALRGWSEAKPNPLDTQTACP